MPGSQKAAGLARLGRVADVDGNHDVVAEAVDQRRGIGPRSADIPYPVQTDALDRHEADLTRRFGSGDIPDGHAGRPSASLGRARREVGGLAFVVARVVGERRQSLHVPGIDDHQEVVVRLQMDVPGMPRRLDMKYRCGEPRVAHVDDAEPLRVHVADIGVAPMHHHLVAVRRVRPDRCSRSGACCAHRTGTGIVLSPSILSANGSKAVQFSLAKLQAAAPWSCP